MKDRVQDFLQVYKNLELVCREKGKEVLDMETELGVDNSDPFALKIRLCRQLRNYCTHNDYTDFIVISTGMIKFVKDATKQIKKIKLNKKKK